MLPTTHRAPLPLLAPLNLARLLQGFCAPLRCPLGLPNSQSPFYALLLTRCPVGRCTTNLYRPFRATPVTGQQYALAPEPPAPLEGPVSERVSFTSARCLRLEICASDDGIDLSSRAVTIASCNRRVWPRGGQKCDSGRA